MGNFPLDWEWIEQIFSEIRDGVIAVDLQLRIIYINKATKAIGLSTENDIGKSLFKVFPNLKEEYSAFVQVLSTGKPITNQNLSFITYRGERKTTLTSTFPMYKDGILVGAFEVFQDISAIEELSNKMVSLQKKHLSFTSPHKSDKPKLLLDESILGSSEEIIAIKNKIPILSKSKSPIFIYGETGTGKELIVQAIHSASTNRKAPFIAQNCAAIPESLLEGILFGTIKGGFTGAENRPGLFELAHGGTLFLDEINSMPLSLQSKLLRVLQEGKIRRIGGQKELAVQVRIVAATNVHPAIIVNSGELRKDLYYRLNVIYLEVPPLRDRKEDIPELINHFVKYYNKLFQKSFIGIDNETLDFFYKYDWPGNIRELRNLIERAMNLGEGDYIQLKDIQIHTLLSLQPQYKTNSSTLKNIGLKEAIMDLELKMIKQALKESLGNISKAARQLDIPQQTLNNKIEKYKLRSFIYEIKANTRK